MVQSHASLPSSPSSQAASVDSDSAPPPLSRKRHLTDSDDSDHFEYSPTSASSAGAGSGPAGRGRSQSVTATSRVLAAAPVAATVVTTPRSTPNPIRQLVLKDRDETVALARVLSTSSLTSAPLVTATAILPQSRSVWRSRTQPPVAIIKPRRVSSKRGRRPNRQPVPIMPSPFAPTPSMEDFASRFQKRLASHPAIQQIQRAVAGNNDANETGESKAAESERVDTVSTVQSMPVSLFYQTSTGRLPPAFSQSVTAPTPSQCTVMNNYSSTIHSQSVMALTAPVVPLGQDFAPLSYDPLYDRPAPLGLAATVDPSAGYLSPTFYDQPLAVDSIVPPSSSFAALTADSSLTLASPPRYEVSLSTHRFDSFDDLAPSRTTSLLFPTLPLQLPALNLVFDPVMPIVPQDPADFFPFRSIVS